MKQLKRLALQVVHQTFIDEVPRLSAALAFYSVFSLAPILIVAVALAGLVFGQEAALERMVDQVRQLMGRQTAELVRAIVLASAAPFANIVATIIGVITLFFGATGALVELQAGLNSIWGIHTETSSLRLLKERLNSLALVAAIAFLLLVSLVISAAISAFGKLIRLRITELSMWQGVDFVLSCLILTFLFAIILKILPDNEMDWKDSLWGGCVTAILFTLGKLLMGLYIAKGSFLTTYGAAGSLVALLTWVYYSAFVLYVGAEITKAHAVPLLPKQP